MADKRTGWYKLQRDILDSPLWEMDEPFGKRDAYIDLLLLANYEEKKFYPKHSNQVITVHVGQLVTSCEKLAVRWKWSKKRVTNFLNQLEKGNALFKKTYNWGTVLTLRGYGIEGDKGNARDTACDTDRVTPIDTSNDTGRVARLKKDKKDKKDKNKRNQEGAPAQDVGFVWGDLE